MSNPALKIRKLTSLNREKFAATTAINEYTLWSIIGDHLPELLPQLKTFKTEEKS